MTSLTMLNSVRKWATASLIGLLWWLSMLLVAMPIVGRKPSPPPTLTPDEEYKLREWRRCYKSVTYFIRKYVKILDGTTGQWIPFELWSAQAQALKEISLHQLIVILKARQIGLSWLVLAYALHKMIFSPIATILIFSKRDDEAVYLLGEDRLKGMFRRLPAFLKEDLYPTYNNDHVWKLSNGSIARAFPTTGGDSYTATLAIIDEADLVENFDKMISAVKPTIDAGGQMIALSRANKDDPGSGFKRTYKAALKKGSQWHPIFLPWHVRPERTQQWYQNVKADAFERTGAHDETWEQYPATAEEALAPRSLSKRIPPEWLKRVYTAMDPLQLGKTKGVPSLPPLSLKVYRLPEKGRRYVIGIDTAGGNFHSDDSAISIFDHKGEEVALAVGKWEPDTTAEYAYQLAKWYNNAYIMPERNNHGSGVLTWFRSHAKRANLMLGWDAPRSPTGKILPIDRKAKRGDTIRYGWLSNNKGKATMYNEIATSCRDSTIIIHSFEVWEQLSSIEASTLLAPTGFPDDIADAAAIAVASIPLLPVRTGRGVIAGFGLKGWGVE